MEIMVDIVITPNSPVIQTRPAMLSRALVVVAFGDICVAADQVPWILEHRPIGLEAMDNVLFEDEMKQKMHTTQLTKLPAHDRDGGWLDR